MITDITCDPFIANTIHLQSLITELLPGHFSLSYRKMSLQSLNFQTAFIKMQRWLFSNREIAKTILRQNQNVNSAQSFTTPLRSIIYQRNCKEINCNNKIYKFIAYQVEITTYIVILFLLWLNCHHDSMHCNHRIQVSTCPDNSIAIHVFLHCDHLMVNTILFQSQFCIVTLRD